MKQKYLVSAFVASAIVLTLVACNDSTSPTGPETAVAASSSSVQVGSSVALISSVLASSSSSVAVTSQPAISSSIATMSSNIAKSSVLATSSIASISSSSTQSSGANSSSSETLNSHMDQTIVGTWNQVATTGTPEKLIIGQNFVTQGIETLTPSTGMFLEAKNNAIGVIGAPAYSYSYLVSNDTLYFNNPGVNWTTFLPNPVQVPVSRTDANTKAYKR